LDPAWSLAQASDPVGQQSRVNQLTRALHSATVIKLPSHCFLANTYTKTERRKKTLLGEDEGEYT